MPPTPNDSVEVKIARIETSTSNIERDIKDLKENYVTRAEFVPVRMAVYGLIAFICLSLLGIVVKNSIAERSDVHGALKQGIIQAP